MLINIEASHIVFIWNAHAYGDLFDIVEDYEGCFLYGNCVEQPSLLGCVYVQACGATQ